MGGGGGGGSSSSDEEEDPKWKAAIQSIAAATTFGLAANGSSSNAGNSKNDGYEDKKPESSKQLKHYQLKIVVSRNVASWQAQKLLDDILGRDLEIVRDCTVSMENGCPGDDAGVRLFKDSPAGIVFDHGDEIQGPRKRPRLLRKQESDEKLKKLRQKVKSVSVDGADIISAATYAAQKSLARLEAKDAMRKEKAKREEERVAELKKIRGVRWLPSIAREMQLNKSSSQRS